MRVGCSFRFEDVTSLSLLQVKHVQVNGMPRSQYLNFAIENLTSDDVRHLITAEDELHRAGK